MVSHRRGYRGGRYQNELREGPIHIYPNFAHALVGMVFLVIGASLLGITSKYSNSSQYSEDHSCPALEGRVFNWVRNDGILFVILAVIVFSVAGIIPKIFHVTQLRDNAVCCGKIFMSNFGYVCEFISFALFILFNVYGTILTKEAYERGIQTEKNYPREKFETYCSKVIWNTYRVMNYGKCNDHCSKFVLNLNVFISGTYAFIGLYVVYLIQKTVRKLNRFTQKVGKPKMSFTLKEREILDVFGYKYNANEVQEDSKNAKKDNVIKAKNSESSEISTEEEIDAKSKTKVHKKRKSVAVISKKRNV